MTTSVPVLILILAILGWRLYQLPSYSRLNLLSWLQSVALMLPWLLWFGAAALNLPVNLTLALMAFIGSTGVYIWLGGQIRQGSGTGSDSGSETDNDAGATGERGMEAQDQPSSAKTATTVASSRDKSADISSISGGGSADGGRRSPGTASSPAAGTRSYPAVDAELVTAEGSLQRLTDEEIQSIQSIFSLDTFFAIGHSEYHNGVLFNGNLRGDADTVFASLSQRLSALADDAYRLYLINSVENKPVVLVFPRTNDPVPSTPLQWGLAVVLFGVTVLTCMMAAAIFQGFDVLQNWERWPETVFLSGGVILILVGHELAHWTAARRHQIRLGPPLFMPTWQIGSFGAITRFESVVPSRTALFDVAFAGPALGGALALVCLVLGLGLSQPGSLFQLSPVFFQSSVLVGGLARLLLGNAVQNDLVDIHPLVIVGWLGLLITAINLMPAGQLDGGRIVQAIYGRKIVRWTSIVTLVVLAIATFFSPLALYWMAVILFLQRRLEQPSQNEITEPDDTRALLGLLALFLMATILLPLSPELASRLGIGG